MAEVDFYFYLGCPRTYLACGRLLETAMRTSARIIWKPVLIDLRGTGPRSRGGPVDVDLRPAMARYEAKDLQDWARFCGVRITRGELSPVKATWALRGAVAAAAAGRAAAFCEAAFRSCFEAGADLDDIDRVVEVARTVGLEPSGFRAATLDEATLRVVGENSRELLARGGFGSPTMFVGDDMYFGNDRMPLVELALSRAADRPLIAPGAHGQM